MVFGLWLTMPSVSIAQTAPPLKSAPTEPPVISDDDFTKALPTVDTPPSVPATEAPSALPPSDSELGAPLPPLTGYDVQPQTTASTPEDTPPQIAYAVELDGLWGDMKARFRSLSALQNGKGKAINSAMVRARATEDEALILRLLTSEGYFDGTVTTRMTTGKDQGVTVYLSAVPGSLYHLGQIRIDAPPTLPPDLLRQALPLKTGDPLIADVIIAAEAHVSMAMTQQGYPFGKIGERDVQLDPVAFIGDYSLKVDPGHRSRFGGFQSDGQPAFDTAHIAVLSRFKRGDLYDNRQVDDLRDALSATGLFRSVTVEPITTDQKADDGSDYVDLRVHQTKGANRSLAATAGYSTGEGFTATASWQNRNLFPPEGALIVTGALGTQEQGLTTTFRRSNDKARDRTLSLSGGLTHNSYDSYEAYTSTLSGSVARVSTPLWQKVWTWSYGAELVATSEALYKKSKQKQVYTSYYLAALPTKIGYDRSDDLLNPATGYRLSAEVTPELAISGGGTHLRTVLDASLYHALNDKMIIATRARLGTLLGGNLNDIAPSRRLYAGGGGSVRGYGYQALGPHDSSNAATGGQSLIEASIELRYRFGDYGIVPFIDMGQAYDSQTPSFKDIHVGVGVGARLYTNFGPIRIDIATPLNRKNKDAPIALYVGIGQAF